MEEKLRERRGKTDERRIGRNEGERERGTEEKKSEYNYDGSVRKEERGRRNEGEE